MWHVIMNCAEYVFCSSCTSLNLIKRAVALETCGTKEHHSNMSPWFDLTKAQISANLSQCIPLFLSSFDPRCFAAGTKGTDWVRRGSDCRNVPLSIVNFASSTAAVVWCPRRTEDARPRLLLSRPSFPLPPSVVMPHLLKLPPSFGGRANRIAKLSQTCLKLKSSIGFPVKSPGFMFRRQ